MLPTIVNISKAGKEATDLISNDFIKNRTIYLFSEIDAAVSLEIIAQLNYLDSCGTDDITLVINSPGGQVSAGLAIIDKMKSCRCKIRTVCTGIAASMGALILSCGTKGLRSCTPNSEVMIHQPLGGAQGQASDIELVANHIIRTKKRLTEILAENTGRDYEQVSKDCDRDYFMSAEEALAYGIVDSIS